MPREQPQQVEFGAGEIHWPSAHMDGARRRVDLEADEAQSFARAGFRLAHPGPAQDRPHMGQQHARLHRLGDELVGAELQPDDAVEVVASGGQDDNGHQGAPCTQLAADAEAVHAGQHEVQHHEVGRNLASHVDGRLAPADPMDLERVARQVLDDELAQPLVVLHQQNAGAGIARDSGFAAFHGLPFCISACGRCYAGPRRGL